MTTFTKTNIVNTTSMNSSYLILIQNKNYILLQTAGWIEWVIQKYYKHAYTILSPEVKMSRSLEAESRLHKLVSSDMILHHFTMPADYWSQPDLIEDWMDLSLPWNIYIDEHLEAFSCTLEQSIDIWTDKDQSLGCNPSQAWSCGPGWNITPSC